MTYAAPHPHSRRSFLARSALGAVAVTGASTLLSACGSSSGSGVSDDGRATFLTAIPLETLSFAPELLATAGGYFKDHDLDVKLQPVNGTSQAVQVVLAGRAPITRVGQIDLMTAATQSETPLMNIGTILRGPSVRFVYSKDRPITKPQDLVGQKMGIPSEGGTASKVVSLAMAGAGLAPEDVEQQVVGLAPGTFNFVQQGRIAGYVVSIDTANIIAKQNPDAGIFDPSAFVTSDSQLYASTQETIDDSSDTLRSFLAAVRESTQAIVDDKPEETIKRLRAKYSFASLDDDEVARASIETFRELYRGGGSVPLLSTDEQVWTSGYAELVSAGLAPDGGKSEAWIDNSLIPA